MKDPIFSYGKDLILNWENKTQLRVSKIWELRARSYLFFLRVLGSGFNLENAYNKGTKKSIPKISSQISLMGQADF